MKQLSDMQSEVAFNYAIHEIPKWFLKFMNFFYISFSHAIIKRIFKFAPIVPSYLIVHTVQTFWPSIFHKQGSFFM